MRVSAILDQNAVRMQTATLTLDVLKRYTDLWKSAIRFFFRNLQTARSVAANSTKSLAVSGNFIERRSFRLRSSEQLLYGLSLKQHSSPFAFIQLLMTHILKDVNVTQNPSRKDTLVTDRTVKSPQDRMTVWDAAHRLWETLLFPETNKHTLLRLNKKINSRRKSHRHIALYLVLPFLDTSEASCNLRLTALPCPSVILPEQMNGFHVLRHMWVVLTFVETSQSLASNGHTEAYKRMLLWAHLQSNSINIYWNKTKSVSNKRNAHFMINTSFSQI
jgi:hypothetical protein